MNVKCAKDHIQQINKVCDDINIFVEKHEELMDETGFFCDAVAFLCDYRRTLENAIEQAELNI